MGGGRGRGNGAGAVGLELTEERRTGLGDVFWGRWGAGVGGAGEPG